MPYAEVIDVERAAGGRDKLTQLTDIDNAGQVDTAYLAEVVADADSWANSFIQHRHDVPIPDSDVPQVLRNLSAKESVYLLKVRRESPTDGDTLRHEERLAWLMGVRDGSISLGLDPRLPKSSSVKPARGGREASAFSLTRLKFADSGWT